MVSPEPTSDHEGSESKPPSKPFPPKLYGDQFGTVGNSIAGDTLPDELPETATLGPVPPKSAFNSSTSHDTRPPNPILMKPLKVPQKSAIVMPVGSAHLAQGRGRTRRLISPLKAPFPSSVRAKPGSTGNPIDVDAMHPTWNGPAKNQHMMGGSSSATSGRPGVYRVIKPAAKTQKSVRPSLSNHRSVITRPLMKTTNQHSEAMLSAAESSYQAAGQNVPNVRSLLGNNSYRPPPYQKRDAPRSFTQALPQYLPPPKLPPNYTSGVRYPPYPVDSRQYSPMPLPLPQPVDHHHYSSRTLPLPQPMNYYPYSAMTLPLSQPVDLCQYPPMTFPLSQPAHHQSKYMPESTLAPSGYDMSNYHQQIGPQPNTALDHVDFLLGREASLRQRAAHYKIEISKPSPKKRGVFDDSTAQSGSEPFTQVVVANNRSFNNYAPGAFAYELPSVMKRNRDLSALISHTEVLTNTLEAYPPKCGKAKQREDLQACLSGLNQRFRDWIATEKAEHMRKQAKLFNTNKDSNRMVYAILEGRHGGDETKSKYDGDDEDEDMESY